MRILSALGVIAGGFLLSPPPRSVALALFWLGARAHPVITIAVVLAVAHAWRADHD